MTTLPEESTPIPVAREGRASQLMRSWGRALAASKLNRAAALALIVGVGLGVYGSVTEGSESLARGGWTTALTAISILTAYTTGFLIRRALRLVLVLAGATAGAIAILKVSGVDVSLSGVTAFASEQADQIEGWIKGWLPSGAGAATGLFFGLRRGKRAE